MKTIDLEPLDTLFFRDARPLAAGSGYGHGANWPLPGIVHTAIRNALLQQIGVDHTAKNDGFERDGKVVGSFTSEHFNWLNIRGPFPFCTQDASLYFPTPIDLMPGSSGNTAEYLKVIERLGDSNLPNDLPMVAASYATPSKTKLPQWISFATYERYLRQGSGTLAEINSLNLWDTEHRIGVAIDPVSQTAADGQLYAAEHMRLRDGIRLRISLSEPPSHKPRIQAEIDALASLEASTVQLGGERRCCRISNQNDGALVLPSAKTESHFVKWVLLTPAIFTYGWRPGWIGEDRQVKLRVKPDGFDRQAHRRARRDAGGGSYETNKHVGEEIIAKLMAACVPKPQVVGGWDLTRESKDKGGDEGFGTAKPTMLAVPSGSVFYFEAQDTKHAAKLREALQGRCRSDFFGEKGFGLGVCGTWEPFGQRTT